MKFTPTQQQAIDQQATNILVAAAAGSGKTAVLVERIIQKILQRHCQVDELVVLTFTNAAAQEMRQRIRTRLEQVNEASVGEEKRYLKQQLQRLNQAQISTFHAFCIRLLRNFYYASDIDPQFRIGDEFELALLKTQAMEAILEHCYSQEEPAFLAFVEAYSADRGDESVQQLIFQLANFKQSVVDQAQWQQQALTDYQTHTEFLHTPIGERIRLEIEQVLETWQTQLSEAVEAIDTNEKNADKALTIINTYQQAIAQQQAALAKQSWQPYFQSLHKIEVANWPARVAPDAKARVDYVKKARESHVERYRISQEQICEQFLEIGKQLQQLFTLTESYETHFGELKQQRNIVDFSDLERKTLQLLQQHPEIAAQYRQNIHELLVDEYQDTNEVQETIVQLCSNGDNVFMVGDVKQSIYRFRSADPTLFQSKYQQYTQQKDAGVRIDLNQNFRSRSQVLDFINYTFGQLMDKQVAEIAYDEKAQLYLGATYPEHSQMQVEFSVLHLPEAVDKVENQAHYLVQKIEQLIASEFLVHDRGQTRPIRYADIAILFRTRSAVFDRLSELLKEAQIPYVAQEQGGYFDASEIRNLLAILRIIDNPFDDIEYASWLRGPIIGLDENDLLTVRLAAPKLHVCEQVQKLVELPECEPQLLAKLQRAQTYEQQWRVALKQKPLAEWIEQIIFATGYYDFVGGLANGIHRQANIDALIEKARTYEAIGFRSLFKFNRFISAMQKQNQDFTNSRSIAEQENVVQLMTIHKSKGLEFPVVFVAELQKQFNRRDSLQTLVLDKREGASLLFVDNEKNYTVRSLMQTFIAEKIEQAQLAEELRILYVALTRAKEKLILVAQTAKDLAGLQKQFQPALLETAADLAPTIRLGAKSYFEWLMQAMIRHQQLSQFQSSLPVAPATITQAPLDFEITYYDQSFVHDQVLSPDLQVFAQALRQGQCLPEVTYPQVVHALSFVYPHQAATKHYAQVSISDLKRLAAEQEVASQIVSLYEQPREQERQAVLPLPNFIQQPKQTQALLRGTSYHLAMQYLPQTMSATNQAVTEYLATLALSPEQRALVSSEWIVTFLQSELGQLFAQATNVQRELPFSLLRPSETVYQEWSGSSEAVLMRGIFDALYHFDDEIVIVDYKTDFVGNFDSATQAQLRERYSLQMQTYLYAAKKLFADSGKVIHGELYFFQAQQSLQF